MSMINLRARCFLLSALLAALLNVVSPASGQQKTIHPGLTPYTPTRIDWLVTTLQASLRDDELDTNGFTLNITNPDSETIQIYVRYTANVNREVMNISIDTAREVIGITARSYGWSDWVKVRENVQMAQPQNQ